MKRKKLPIIYYVVSLGYATRDNYNICFEAKEIKNILSKYIRMDKKGKLIISQYRIENRHILEDYSRNEFVKVYFDEIYNDIHAWSHITDLTIDLY